MDRKQAIDIIDGMINESKQQESVDSLKELRDKLTMINMGYGQPLRKAIEEVQDSLKKASGVNLSFSEKDNKNLEKGFGLNQNKPNDQEWHKTFKEEFARRSPGNKPNPEAHHQATLAANKKHGPRGSDIRTTSKSEKGKEDMKKVDPKTKLPGVMLDKVASGDIGAGSMGSSGMNLTPGSGNQGGISKQEKVGGAPSDAPPMLASEKHDGLKTFMQKCMKHMNAKKSMAAMSEKPAAVPMNKASAATTGHVGPAPVPQPKVNVNISSRAGGMGMGGVGKSMKKALGGEGAPSTPTPRQDSGFGKVVVKAAPHIKAPAPNPKDPAMNPGTMAPHPPTSNYKHKATAFLKQWKNNKPPVMKKEDFPKKQADFADKQEPQELNSEGKRAITEPRDQPIKISADRPGQANKQSPPGKLK